MRLTHSKILDRNGNEEGIQCGLGATIRNVRPVRERWGSGLHSRTPVPGCCDGEAPYGVQQASLCEPGPGSPASPVGLVSPMQNPRTGAFPPSATSVLSHRSPAPRPGLFHRLWGGASPASTFQSNYPTPNPHPALPCPPLPTTTHHSCSICTESFGQDYHKLH